MCYMLKMCTTNYCTRNSGNKHDDASMYIHVICACHTFIMLAP